MKIALLEIGLVAVSETLSRLGLAPRAGRHLKAGPDARYNASPGVAKRLRNLLGAGGLVLLEEVCASLQKFAEDGKWPLVSIEAGLIEDPEIENWDRVVLYLHVRSTTRDVEAFLDAVYEHLDCFERNLPETRLTTFRKLIFVDAIATP